MAKKVKRTVVREYVEPDEIEDQVVSAVSDSAEDSYSGFVSKFGREGVTVKVHRQTPQGKQYCFFGPPSEIDEEVIRLYHAKQPYAHESGLYFVSVYVHGEFRDSFPVPIAPQVATPGSSSGNGSGVGVDVVRMLQEQNARLEQYLFKQNANVEREPINAIADAMLKIDTLRGGQQPREMPIDSLIKAIELGKTLGGEASGDWKVLLLEALKDSMPAIQNILMAASNKAAPAAIPAQVASPQQNETPPQEPNMMDELLLKQAIDFLKRKALIGSDPGLYIDWVLDNRDVPLYAKLIRRVLDSDFSAFAAIDPDISKPQFEPFFRNIFDGLRSAFVPADPVADNSGRSSGNAGHTARNGATGKGGVKKS